MSRLREGRANTVRGAAHFLRETVGRVRYGGARGQLTVRADSGFYTHALVAVCRAMDVRFSITIRQHARLRNIIEAIPEEDWTPIPYWMDGAAAVAEASYSPFQSEPNAAPVQLIVRRVKPTPGSQLALFAAYSYHGFITDRDGQPWHWRPTIAATPRSRMPSETSSPASGSTISPRAASPPILSMPKGAWLAVQSLPRTRYGVIAHNLVWYVGMRQTDPTWVEENRGPAWSSHPILIEPEQLPGPIAPASCKEGPTRKGRRSHRRYRWKENRDS